MTAPTTTDRSARPDHGDDLDERGPDATVLASEEAIASDRGRRWASWPVGVFWASVVAVPVSTAVVTAVLSRHVEPGELSVITAVFVLALISAVVPMAVQADVAASRVATGRRHDLPWRSLITATVSVALIGAGVGPLLGLPAAAMVFGILQVLPGVAVGRARGEMIADRSFGAAATNQLVEAALRLFFGLAFGLAYGANGVAASLLLAMFGAWAAVPRDTESTARHSTLALPIPLFALALFTTSVHLDLVLGPKILGPLADDYAVAALPAKGVFLVLMAMGWLVIPTSTARRTVAQLRRPAVATAIAGAVLALGAAAAAPVVALGLGRPVPDRLTVLLLGLAMAAASGTWVGLQVLLTRAAPRLWLPAVTAVVVAVPLSMAADSLVRFAVASCIGQGLAFAVTLHRLRVLAGGEVVIDLTGAEARFTERLFRFPRPGERAVTRSGPRCDTRVLALMSAGLGLAALLQRPGLVVSETKLDLAIDPVTFLGRLWHLWEPAADFGRIQNQAVGYAFPMGPAFLVAKLLNIPEWLTIRLWMGLLLIAAFWGVARLADELRIGVPATRVIAALAYALTPMMLARIGNTSALVISVPFLPWVLLPLVRASKTGSVRRAAALSGLAVLCVGGVNGAVTAAVLIMPALYLLTRQPGPRRRAMLGWWAVAVVLASFWWVAPLVFQARYGFNFLPFTERAQATTAFASPVEALRGTSDWLSYLNLQGPWLSAGWWLVSNPFVIVATAVLAGIGLAGLARRDLEERVFLVLTLLVGVVLVTCGYAAGHGAMSDAWLSNPAGGLVRDALDGAAGMFRNVWKFQPVVALPLALGTAHVLSVVRLRRSADTPSGDTAFRRTLRRAAAPAVAVAALALVGVSALPVFAGDAVSAKGWSDVPDYWKELAAFHEQHTGDGRLLVLPGASTGDYVWGRPLDEPLQVSTQEPWAVRSLIPLGGPGSSLALDAIERVVQRGGDPALASYLARAGFTYVVVRNDLDWRTWGVPRPSQVASAMAASGFVKETSFGPTLDPHENDPFGVADAERRLHALEVYRVDPDGAARATGAAGGAAEEAHGLVTSYLTQSTKLVSGGPGSLLTLQDEGLLRDEPALLEGDDTVSSRLADPPDPQSQIITDSLPNTWSDHGLIRNNESYPLADGESVAGGRDAVTQLRPSPEAPRTFAIQDGVQGVTASSYGSWLYQLPEMAPANAIDGDPATVWTTGPAKTSVGEWLEVSLDGPTDLDHVDLTMLADGPWRPTVREVQVTTDAGSIFVPIAPGEAPQRLPVPPGPTRKVRVTFTRLDGENPKSPGIGVRELQVPGVSSVRRLVVPAPVATTPSGADATNLPTAFVFQRDVVDPRDLLRQDGERLLHRRFTSPDPADVSFAGRARPVTGPDLFALIDPAGDLSVTASSTYQDYPDYRPANLLDGNTRTAWVARPPEPHSEQLPPVRGDSLDQPAGATTAVASMEQNVDVSPSITMRWNEPRPIGELRIVGAANFSTPTSVLVSNEKGEQQHAPIGPDGEVTLTPFDATELHVSFPTIDWRTTATADGETTTAPLAVGELSVPALDDLLPGRPAASTRVEIPCEDGPTAIVDGHTTHFSISSTVGELAELKPARVASCDETPLSLPSGQHDLDTSVGRAPFNIETLAVGPKEVLTPDRSGTESITPQPAAVRTETWTADHRQIHIDAGPATMVVVSENDNPGWRATYDGAELPQVQVDGWRQGYLVPAGDGGTIDLSFAPTSGYRATLLLGLAFVVLLVGLAFWRSRSDRSPAASELPPLRSRGFGPRIALVLLAGTGLWLGGVVGLALAIALWFVYERLARHVAALVVGAMALAGLAVALAPASSPADGVGAFGVPAQLFSVVAILLVAGSLLVLRRPSPAPDAWTPSSGTAARAWESTWWSPDLPVRPARPEPRPGAPHEPRT